MKQTILLLSLLTSLAAEAAPKVEGTFLLDGKDAKLQHIRAARVKLDEKGKTGYAVLMSARPAEGQIERWQTADPAERGSFIFLMLEQNGAVWVAELGHDAADGRFGVVIEVATSGFSIKDNHLVAKLSTAREEEFGGNHYTIDLTFEVTVEK